jgi:hypothetical protein
MSGDSATLLAEHPVGDFVCSVADYRRGVDAGAAERAARARNPTVGALILPALAITTPEPEHLVIVLNVKSIGSVLCNGSSVQTK